MSEIKKKRLKMNKKNSNFSIIVYSSELVEIHNSLNRLGNYRLAHTAVLDLEAYLAASNNIDKKSNVRLLDALYIGQDSQTQKVEFLDVSGIRESLIWIPIVWFLIILLDCGSFANNLMERNYQTKQNWLKNCLFLLKFFVTKIFVQW